MVQPDKAGDYFVVAGNGIQTITSVVATLTVNTNSMAPRIESPPGVAWFPTTNETRLTNLVVTASQRAILGVFCKGLPVADISLEQERGWIAFVDVPGVPMTF